MVAQLYYHDRVPKLIDHERRRAELAEAVWRIVDRDGLGAVSVRHVAAEAGVSAGSLRHVLASREEMLDAAMELVVERARDRFTARARLPLRNRDDLVALLAELLPLDEERRLELRTHLGLVVAGSGQAGTVAWRTRFDAAVREACRTVLRGGVGAGLLAPDLDLEGEASRLHVLVDGLALHLLGPGEDIDGDDARAALDRHLAALGATGP